MSPAAASLPVAGSLRSTLDNRDAASLQSTLDKILADVFSSTPNARAISLEVVREPLSIDRITHVVFFALGFLSEGKSSNDALSGVLSATDASRVAIVRVVWDAGDPGEVITAVTAAHRSVT